MHRQLHRHLRDMTEIERRQLDERLRHIASIHAQREKHATDKEITGGPLLDHRLPRDDA